MKQNELIVMLRLEAGDMSDGAIVVMFFNKGEHPTEMMITFDSLNLMDTNKPVNVVAHNNRGE